MPVIKEFESRVADIECLETLIHENSQNAALKKRLETELRKVKIGDHAEKNAGYLLGELYKGRDDAFLINGLRLELGNDIAQIDHLSINSLGFVRLFETKTFSTGVKIDDDGTFWRWDGYNKTYIEIPSPIEQSKRHERIVRLAFEKVGFKIDLIKHFVVIDYKAKLIKLKKGFENVCRPDRVEEAINDSIEGKDLLLAGLKLVGNMVTGKSQDLQQIQLYTEKLAELHTPIEFNYRAKFGLDSKTIEPPATDKTAEPEAVYEAEKQAVTIAEPVTPTIATPDKLTLSKKAASLNLKTAVFEKLLIEKGYLERREKGVYLSQKGKDSGFEVRKGRFGFYFLIPNEFSLEVVMV